MLVGSIVIVNLLERILVTIPWYITGILSIPKLSRASAGLAGVRVPGIY